MGLVFNFDDIDKMQPGPEITFDSLDFVADQLGNLYLQEPNPPMQEEEPPSICMFLAGLEETMETGPLALANHMDLYAWETFAEFSREHILDKICMLLGNPCWVPATDPTLLLDCILTGYPTRLQNVTATYNRWLCQTVTAAPDLSALVHEVGDWRHNDDNLDRFIVMASIHNIDDGAMDKEPMIGANNGADHSDASNTDIIDLVEYDDLMATDIIDLVEYDDLMAKYVIGDDEVGDGLSHLRECYMANTQDGDGLRGGNDEHFETHTPRAGYNNVEVPYETSQQI